MLLIRTVRCLQAAVEAAMKQSPATLVQLADGSKVCCCPVLHLLLATLQTCFPGSPGLRGSCSAGRTGHCQGDK